MNRIQRKRTKGYSLPANCKYVGRPTKFGNPFRVDEHGMTNSVERYKECILNNAMVYYYFDEIDASIQFERFKWMAENINNLRQYDSLACWCPMDKPCHVDVLIKLLTNL